MSPSLQGTAGVTCWGMGRWWGPRFQGAAREGGDRHSMAGTAPMRIPVLCNPNPGTYRSRWGSGSWGLTSLGGRCMCSSGCHPRRSRCWHMGCWSSHQYLGRRSS